MPLRFASFAAALALPALLSSQATTSAPFEMTVAIDKQQPCALDAEAFLVSFDVRATYTNASDLPIAIKVDRDHYGSVTVARTRETLEQGRFDAAFDGHDYVEPLPADGPEIAVIEPGESFQGRIAPFVMVRRMPGSGTDGRSLIDVGRHYVRFSAAVKIVDSAQTEHLGTSLRNGFRMVTASANILPIMITSPGVINPC